MHFERHQEGSDPLWVRCVGKAKRSTRLLLNAAECTYNYALLRALDRSLELGEGCARNHHQWWRRHKAHIFLQMILSIFYFLTRWGQGGDFYAKLMSPSISVSGCVTLWSTWRYDLTLRKRSVSPSLVCMNDSREYGEVGSRCSKYLRHIWKFQVRHTIHSWQRALILTLRYVTWRPLTTASSYYCSDTGTRVRIRTYERRR